MSCLIAAIGTTVPLEIEADIAPSGEMLEIFVRDIRTPIVAEVDAKADSIVPEKPFNSYSGDPADADIGDGLGDRCVHVKREAYRDDPRPIGSQPRSDGTQVVEPEFRGDTYGQNIFQSPSFCEFLVWGGWTFNRSR